MSKIRFILNSFKTQKMKFILIFLVTFITLLIFNISSCLRESVIDTRLGQLRDMTQNSQIVVSAEDGTYKEFDKDVFWEQYMKDHGDKITDQITRDYCYLEVEGKQERLFLYGTDVKHQDRIYEFQLESGDIENWEYNDILISSAYAKENHLKAGDTLNLKYGESPVNMKVKAISKDEGIFLNAYDFAIASTEFVDQIGERNGLVNRIDLTISNLKEMDEITNEINKKLEGTGLAAVAKYNLSYFQAYVTTVVLALNLFSIFLLLLTVYMLYSLFQSYVYENVGQMATLRSIGYSIMEYRMILCWEAFIVDLLAFLCSMGATPFALKLIGGMMFQQNTQVKLDLGILIVKGFAVLVISVVSIYMASYKVSRTPVVSLIRNHVSYQTKTFHKKRLVLAFLALFVSAAVSFLNQKEYKLIYCYVSLVSMLIAVLLFQELLIYGYSTLLNKVFRKRRKSIGLFGKQVKTTLVSYLPAITSLVFVLSIAICILSMSGMLKQAMNKMYSSSDLYMTIYSNDTKPCLDVLDERKEIEKYIVETRKSTKIEEDKVMVTSIEDGLSEEEYKMITDCDDYTCFDELQDGYKAVVSDTLAKRWKRQKGDTIAIENKTFEIVKVIKTFENMGEIVFLSEQSFQDTFTDYDTCIVLIQAAKNQNIDKLKDTIQENVDKVCDAKIMTTKEMCKSNIEANQVIINIILIFAFVILLVSGVGLCSVVIINILLRQREFIVFQTIGIQKNSILKIAGMEALAVSIYGIINALCIQRFLLDKIVELLSYYVGNLSTKQSIASGAGLFLMVLVITEGIFVGVTKKYALSDHLIEQVKVS